MIQIDYTKSNVIIEYLFVSVHALREVRFWRIYVIIEMMKKRGRHKRRCLQNVAGGLASSDFQYQRAFLSVSRFRALE
jgi:hypothetical protein